MCVTKRLSNIAFNDFCGSALFITCVRPSVPKMTNFIIICVPGCFYLDSNVVDDAYPCRKLSGAVGAMAVVAGRDEVVEALL